MANNGIGIKVGLDLQTNQGIKDFNAWSNKVNAIAQKNPIKINVDLDGQKWEKIIQTFVTKNGDLVESTRYVNLATKEEYEQITKVESGFERLQQATKEQASQNNKLVSSQNKLNVATKKSVSVFNDFTATFMKMAKFNTINLIYDAIVNSMSEMIEVTEKLNSATVEFQKVSDLSGESLQAYKEHLGELGAEVGRTMSEMIEGSTTFRKSGFTDEESAQLAKINAMFQNIADEELSASDAAQILISTMKGFNLTANEVEHVADVINEVSNNFAVSSSDISSGLANVSAVAKMAGNSIEETTGMLTAMVEISQSAGKSSRGLRQIITRLTQTLDESSSTGKKLKEIYAGLGIAITDTDGNLRSTYDILSDLAKQWDSLNTNQQQYIALTSSGANQIQNFTALMDNFDSAISATDTAFASMGSAMRENQTYLENSIEAHKKALQAEYENLVASIPLEQLEKKFIDIGTAILKLANNDTVQLTAQITALIAIFALGTKAVSAFQAVLASGSSFAVFINLLGQVIAGETTLTAVTSFLTTTLLANPLFWGVVAVAGIVAIVKIVDKLTVSFKEATEALEESNSAYEQAQSDIESLTQQIEELEKAKDKISQDKLEITDDKQLQKLQQQTDELERQEASLQRQLALAKAKAEIAEKEARKAAQESLTSTVTTDKTTVVGYGQIGGKGGTLGTRFEGAVTSLQNLQDKIVANNREIEKLKQNYDENAKQIDELTAKNETLKQAYEATYKEATTLAETAQDVSDALGEETKAYDGSSTTIGGLIDAFDRLVGWKTDAKDKTVELTDATEDEADSFEEDEQAVSEAKDAFSEFIGNAEDLQSAYESLNKAANEYNKNGIISASTLKALAKLQPEYVAQLEVVNGKMQVGNGLLQEEFNNEKQLAINSVLVAKQLRVQAICQQYVNDKTQDAKTASEQASPQVDALAQSFNTLAQESRKAGTAVQYAWASIAKDEAKKDELQKQLDDVDAWADGMIDSINAVNLGAVESAKSSAGKAKDAWVEAFKEEKDALDNLKETEQITEYEYYERLAELNEKYFGEISGNHEKYIKEYRENEEEIYKGMKEVYDKVRDYLKEAVEQGYEKAINALKKEEKRVLAEIKKQIEAIKKEKEEVIKGIEKQIKALKKEKEAVQKYYNDQIDAIKRENEVLQEQNELLEKQQELQKAKQQKVMVMQNGRFQLTENESAVAQAEQNLSNYEDQLSYEQQIQQLEDLRDATVESIEERIEALEEYKEYMEEYYDEQIERMEEYYDQVQEQYELQIEALQEELDTFKEGYQKEEDLENARLASQVLGMNERKDLYAEELENLKNYINEVNRMLASLGEAGVMVDFSYSPITGYHTGIAEVAGVDMALETRASGDASFGKDEVALVGESPNAELLLGSHVNTVGGGKLMHLQKGTGIVNAESTQTLAGILNGLSTPSTNVANNRSTQQNFSFGTISLPNVTDADSFVNTLSHKFNNYAIQYGNTRK